MRKKCKHVILVSIMGIIMLLPLIPGTYNYAFACSRYSNTRSEKSWSIHTRLADGVSPLITMHAQNGTICAR